MSDKSHHIVLIDDEESIHTIFKASFRKELKSGALTFHHFLNGEEGFNFINKNVDRIDFVLVLSDINMPVMNGFQFLEKLKLNYPDIEVCMCSAYGDEESISKAKSLGAGGYLEKPINIQELKKVMYNKLELN